MERSGTPAHAAFRVRSSRTADAGACTVRVTGCRRFILPQRVHACGQACVAMHHAAPGLGSRSSRRVTAGFAGRRSEIAVPRVCRQAVSSQGRARGRLWRAEGRLDKLLPLRPTLAAGKPQAANLSRTHQWGASCPPVCPAGAAVLPGLRRGAAPCRSLQLGDPGLAAARPCPCPPRAQPH